MLLPLIFILSTSICFGAFSLIRKKYQEYNGSGLLSTVIFVVFYTLFEIAISLLISLCFSQINQLSNITPLTVTVAAIFSATSFISTIICIIGTAYGSLPILMMFATLGSIAISSTYDIILGQAQITNRYIAALLFIAVILIINIINDKKSANESKKSSFIFKLLCVVVFFTNGVGLVFYHIFAINNPVFGNFNFIALYSAFGLIIALIALVFLCTARRKNNSFSAIIKINWKSYLLILLYSILLCVSEALALNTTSIIPVSIHSPLSFAISLVFVTIFDSIFYKTKPNKLQLVQMGAAVLSAILISMN